MATSKTTSAPIPAKEAAEAALNKPSIIKVMTFAAYRVSGKGKDQSVSVIAGAADGRINNGVVELLADNVPFNSKILQGREPAGGKGLLMLYGGRDVADELFQWRTRARKEDFKIAFATIDIEVGYMESNLITRKMLKTYKSNMQFAYVRRMVSDLQADILEQFATLNDQIAPLKKGGSASSIALYPNLFDQVFEQDKDLANLQVLAIPLMDDIDYPEKMRLRQVVYVRPQAKIVNITQGATDAHILLPSWMTNIKTS
ncbi:hypothetical protein [Hydrogenophaga sp. 2FB]|uniref:hypothetical protein n=1 Tax=Hydrogenophaga sp. 2FB TaxID=2502187 RepID=UPI0010F47BCB|nr:hypothetical protein [Hydrogenophaga sp. 2FB]